jgi:quercetin dioxygenase-like cupin family protein
MAIRVFHRDNPGAKLPMIASDARLVVYPGVGAETANMNYVVMEAGEENKPHAHATSEDTILILAGAGTVANLETGEELPFEAGQVIHVAAGAKHQVRGDRGQQVISVGGPCPADRAGLEAAGVLPKQSE